MSIIRVKFLSLRKITYLLAVLSMAIVILFSTVLATYHNVEETVSASQPYSAVILHDGIDIDGKNIQVIRATESLGFDDLSRDVYMISASDYNMLTGSRVHIPEDAYISHLNDMYKNIKEGLPYSTSSFDTGDQSLSLNFIKQIRSPMINLRALDSKFFVIVSDKTFNKLNETALSISLLETDDKEAVKIMNQVSSSSAYIKGHTRYAYHQGYKQETGTRVFIVFFISFLFMLSIFIIQIIKLFSDTEVYNHRQALLGDLGIHKKKLKSITKLEVILQNTLPILIGAGLGYVYVIMNSMGSPMHDFFVHDVRDFSLYFLLGFILINMMLSSIFVRALEVK